MNYYKEISDKINPFLNALIQTKTLTPDTYSYEYPFKYIIKQHNIKVFERPFSSKNYSGHTNLNKFETTMVLNTNYTSNERFNFTKCHEASHLFLGHINNSNSLKLHQLTNKIQSLDEIHADYSASFILLPETMLAYCLLKQYNFYELKNTFYMSSEALQIRLTNLLTHLNVSYKEAKEIVLLYENGNISPLLDIAQPYMINVSQSYKKGNLDTLKWKLKLNGYIDSNNSQCLNEKSIRDEIQLLPNTKVGQKFDFGYTIYWAYNTKLVNERLANTKAKTTLFNLTWDKRSSWKNNTI